MALHLGWQVVTLDPADGEGALRRFRSNRAAGLLMALAALAVGYAG
jgi:4-hydroxybenzoate polyprenyltransferase